MTESTQNSFDPALMPQGNPQGGMLPQAQNGEFLKYLIDSQDFVEGLVNELEGKEYVYSNQTDPPTLQQVRAPMINPALRNTIVSILKMYNSKTFRVTTFKEEVIMRLMNEMSHNVVDILARCRRYHSNDWKTDTNFQTHYPAFLYGAETTILLSIEHNVLAVLNSSQNGLTLKKVTGMHQSIENRMAMPEGAKKGVISSIFGKK